MDVTTPLLVSADPLLVADVQRLCAAAGVVPEVVHDSVQALRRWTTAPVVLVGEDCATALAGCGPARRSRVHVLGRSPVGDALFRDALGMGAESVASLPASETWLVELLTDVGDGGAEVDAGDRVDAAVFRNSERGFLAVPSPGTPGEG